MELSCERNKKKNCIETEKVYKVDKKYQHDESWLFTKEWIEKKMSEWIV